MTLIFLPMGWIWKISPMAHGEKLCGTSFMMTGTPAFLRPAPARVMRISARPLPTISTSPEGVSCTPDQIIVGAGVDYLLLLLSQILGRDTVFAMEDPSYMQAWRILTHLEFPVIPITLDKYGMDIKALENSQANVAYITPSHHFPLGIVMPIKRRQEILSWACGKSDRYIIEDDYDSEFRYKGRPIPSLQGIDTHHKVIYMGTFSKAIAPSMRISYLVLPPELLNIYRRNYSFYSNTVPRTEQKQITEFIRQGHFQRHLNRMRNIYKAKRDYILKVLEPYDRKIRISGENSGLHMLIKFLDGRSEKELLMQARKERLHLFGISPIYGREYTAKDHAINSDPWLCQSYLPSASGGNGPLYPVLFS